MEIYFSFKNLFYYESDIFAILCDDNFLKTRFRKILVTFFIFLVTLFMAGNIAKTILSPNVLELAINSVFTTGYSTVLISGWYLLIYKHEVASIYNAMLTEKVFLPRNADEVKIIKSNFYIFRTLRFIFIILIFFGIYGFGLTNFERNEYLPVPMWTPFDLNNVQFFELVYIFQVIVISMLLYFYILVVCCIGGFSTFIGTQCNIICYRLENFSPNENTLKTVIETHQRMSWLAKKCGKLLSPLFLINFLMLIMLAASSLFSITKVPTEDLFVFCYIVFGAYTSALMQCWLVHEMKRKSELLLRAAYDCPWINATKSFKIDLIIFMSNVQAPITFRVIGLVPISLESFVTILRASFSYYTILKNLTNATN